MMRRATNGTTSDAACAKICARLHRPTRPATFLLPPRRIQTSALPGLPWSPEFMEAYQTALDKTPRVEIGARRTVAGTVNAVVIGYFASAAFQNLASAS